MHDIDFEIDDVIYAGFLKSADNLDNNADYNFIYVIEGECTYCKGREKSKLNKDNILIIKKASQYRIKSLDKNSKCILISFNSECEWTFPYVFCNIPCQVHILFEKLLKEFKDREFAYEIHCKSLFYEIIGRVIRTYYIDKYYTDDYRKVLNSIRYLNENFLNSNIDMTEVADASGLSLSYFRKLFTEVMKMSPRAYISALRLNKADELLQYTSMSIAEVSDTLNFENQYYFSNFYKKHRGISPKKFRNEQVNKYE